MTPADRRNCGLGETIANMLFIGCFGFAVWLAGVLVILICVLLIDLI